MGKFQAFLLSLVLLAAPGGYMAWVMINMFMNNATEVGTMMQITAGLSALCGVLTALLPFAILVFSGGGGASNALDSSKETDAKGVDTFDDDDADSAGSFGDDLQDDTEMQSAEEFEDMESADFETVEFETDTFEDDEEFDDFDFDDEDLK